MELWGNLKDFSLPDVIQLVGFGRKTGVLSVEHGGVGSWLYFAQGNVVHAVTRDVEGEDAVYSLFRLDEGEFRFQAEVPAPRQTIFMDPTNLVMEAARLLDEASRSEPRKAGKGKGSKKIVEEEPPPVFALEATGAFVEEAEQQAKPREAITPARARQLITEHLELKFGKESKRLTQAVAKCQDTLEDFQELVVRVERFVSAFVDPRSATQVGNEIREIIRRLPGAS